MMNLGSDPKLNWYPTPNFRLQIRLVGTVGHFSVLK